MPFDIMKLVLEAQNNKYKIKNIVIKDGKFEDTLNIYDTLTEDEQKLYGSRSRKESDYLIFRKVAYTKDTGIPVGYIQLDDSSKVYNDPTLKDVNIGIIIRKEFRGSGLSVILIKEAIKWFKTTDIETMSYITRYGNEASERLAKKCGFVFFRDNKELKEKVFLITNPSLLKSINESAILDPVLKNIVLEAKKDDGISAGDDPNKEDKDDDKSDYSPDDNVGEEEDEGTDYTADENVGEDTDTDTDTNTDDDAGTDEDTTDDNTNTYDEDEGTDYTADENVGEDKNADEGDASGDDAGTGEDEGETTDDSGEGTDETTDDQESDSTESDNGLGGDDEESIANQEKVRNVLLLRSFIKIYKQIQIFSQKISESRRNNILTIVASSQVLDNLKKLENVVYKYIIMSYDNNSYEVNLYNFNYFLEVMRLNLEMIRKANESSEQEENKKEHKKSTNKNKKSSKKKTKEYSPYIDKKKDKKEENKIDFNKLKSGLNYNFNEKEAKIKEALYPTLEATSNIGYVLPLDVNKFNEDGARIVCNSLITPSKILSLDNLFSSFVSGGIATLLGGSPILGLLGFFSLSAISNIDHYRSMAFYAAFINKFGNIQACECVYNLPVKAIEDGMVVDVYKDINDHDLKSVKSICDSSKNARVYGNYIIIQHNGFFSLYGHLKKSSIKLKKWDKVKKNQQIALVGESGTYGACDLKFPYLYFEMLSTLGTNRKSDSLYNPLIRAIPKSLDGFSPYHGFDLNKLTNVDDFPRKQLTLITSGKLEPCILSKPTNKQYKRLNVGIYDQKGNDKMQRFLTKNR